MNGAIACGHIKTAEVAEEVLKAGGNAFDAAIAAAMAMFITEPCMSSLAGGGFALIKTADGQIRTLDFFCQTPQNKSKDQILIPVEVDFGNATELYYAGHGASAVPGIPAMLQTLAHQLGTMPFKELAQPAIQLCKEGVQLNWFQNFDLYLLGKLFALSPEKSRSLFDENGTPKPIGSTIKMPELATTLDFIAEEGIQDFYVGDIANIFFKEHQSHGGIQQPEDWSSYSSIWRGTSKISFQESTVFTTPLPSMGGLWQRSFLDQLNLKNCKPFSMEHLELLSHTYLKERPIRINHSLLEQRYPNLTKNIIWENRVTQGTSHFNILDKWRNAISLTTTVGSGAGAYIANTGIYLNNMLGEEGLMPGDINSWRPNTRLHSSTCPTMVQSNDGTQELFIGSGGSVRIPYMIAQAIVNHTAFNMPIQEAISAPRVFDDLQTIQVEPGFEVKNDPLFNHWSEQNLFFGGVHAISKNGKQITAGADPRREGFAKVF